jgi:hypothetical protein
MTLTGSSLKSPRLVKPTPAPLKRALSWRVFERRYEPIPFEDGSLIWPLHALPTEPNRREWWTVLDPMTGRLYLTAGFSFVNRFGYIRCLHHWDGEAADHPEYVY